MNKIIEELNKKYKTKFKYIEKENLATDGYLCVYFGDKQDVINLINLLQNMSEMKKKGGLSSTLFNTQVAKQLAQFVLDDKINDYEILEETDNYIVYNSTLELGRK